MTIQELNNEQLLDMYDVQMFYEGDTLKDVRNEILSRMKSYRRPDNSNTKCPKCGCTGIRNKFYAKGSLKSYDGHSFIDPIDGLQYITPYQSPVETEHIERECFNCGYKWDEMTLDNPYNR